MTGHERAQRNLEVVEARTRGLSWLGIARQHGVSERQARRIVADYRASRPALQQVDPVEVVEETLEAYETAIEDLALLAERTDHDSAKLGAIKARLDVYQTRADLLRSIGVLPDVGHVRVAIDLRQIAARIVDLFDRLELPEHVKSEILDAIDPRTALAPEQLEAGPQVNGQTA